MDDLALQLEGYRLTTAEILYYLPYHPVLIQSVVWQFNDLTPQYPKLHEFLDYWRGNYRRGNPFGRCHEPRKIGPAKTRPVRQEQVLH